MQKLIIAAQGKSKQSRDNKRGSLFEKLIKEVLSTLGFEVENSRVRYSGMEIDIEGHRSVTGHPFIGECKIRENGVTSPELTNFWGKYTSQWFQNKKLEAVFIALPDVNGDAKGFYNTYIKDNKDTSFALIEEESLLKYIFEKKLAVTPEVINKSLRETIGNDQFGDCELIFTDRGYFWIQRIIPHSETLPTRAYLIDSKGNIIKNHETIEYIKNCYSQSDSYGFISDVTSSREGSIMPLSLLEEVVEVQGSSACFEYQLPASPEYFFGRSKVLKDCHDFFKEISENKRATRGLLLLANSGWGKSSLILKLKKALDKEFFVIPIDSRSASTQDFPLKVFDHVMKRICESNFLTNTSCEYRIGGFNSLVSLLQIVDSDLKTNNRFMVVFFDQFENIFFQPSILSAIRTLLAKIAELQLNIVLGFAWKTDLAGMTEEFPYKLRDEITEKCIHIRIELFGEKEISAILNELVKELHSKIRKDLEFQLREYSQGYPWLLKKLCAHVIKQRKKGVTQIDLATRMLNIRELFEEDISDLTPEQDRVLRNIAKRAPILQSDMSSDVLPIKVIQSLIDTRLIVKIGSKYDIYWDIFRDYLNSGSVPVEESYMLRTTPSTILKMISILHTSESFSINGVIKVLKITEKTFRNILKDSKLLELVEEKNNDIILKKYLKLTVATPVEFNEVIKSRIKEKLGKHRAITILLEKLTEKEKLSINELRDIIQKTFSYISADNKTWITYAKIFATWMDFADLAIFQDQFLLKYDPNIEVRSRRQFIWREKSKGVYLPDIQYHPVEMTMEAIATAIINKAGRIDIAGISRSSWSKALRACVELGFISIEGQRIKLNHAGLIFFQQKNNRSQLFYQACQQISVFNLFERIVSDPANKTKTVAELGSVLKKEFNKDWTSETTHLIAKVMINWLKHAGILKNVRRRRKVNYNQNSQLKLID